ncbi:hypothetical protein [Sulfitobacter pacificus]|uniref:hypothetical protein n=1 Tax=Sulfitobacter pacificus TaxID=1499314 RepID=UPI00310633AE
MKYFSSIEEGQAIVQSKGTYRQVPLYERGGRVYAKYGAGFVRLNVHRTTTNPSVKWVEMDTPNGVVKEVGHEVLYTPNDAPALEAAE